MLKNDTATFVANLRENVVEITQLSSGKTAKIDPFQLSLLLQRKLKSEDDKNVMYYSNRRIKISYGLDKRLRSRIIDTYLVNGFDQQLIQYLVDGFIKPVTETTPTTFTDEELEELLRTGKFMELSWNA